jgi:hypothetical protein
VADRATHGELLAVNAGSDNPHPVLGPRHLPQAGAGHQHRWQFPVSVTVSGQNVYVLNAGGDGSVSGFRRAGGDLHAIPGSVRPLGLDGSTPAGLLGSLPRRSGSRPTATGWYVSAKTHGTVDVFAIGANGSRPLLPR